MYRLIVKGNKFEVAQAAADRGIPFAMHCDNPRETQGFTNADVKKILAWFCETNHLDAPLPSGSLLFYTEVKAKWGEM